MSYRDRRISCSVVIFVLIVAGCSDNGSQPSKDPDGDPLTGHEYTWSSQTLSAPNAFQIQIRSIWGASNEDIWAVGHSDLPQHQMWRWVNNEWVDQNTTFPGVNFSLNGIYGFSTNDIWCVGEENKSFPTQTTSFIARFNGIDWIPITELTTSVCRAVWGASDSNIFVSCNDGRIAHHDGSNWTIYQTDTPRAQILSIIGIGTDSVYAVGISPDFVQPADSNFHHFYSFENSQWITVQTVVERIGITELPFGLFLWADERNIIYSAGLGGVYQFNGNSWQRIDNYTSLRSIGGSGSNNLFVGGFSQQLHHYNGQNWFTYQNFNDQSQFFWAIWASKESVHLSSNNGSQTIMIYGEKIE